MNKRMSHDYTNEVELKSLAIREKNKKLNLGIVDDNLNKEINNKIKEFIKTKNSDLKNEIISLSEKVQISEESHSKFGELILLMIKKILTKPNFSGYSYADDFCSDSCYRVLKYIHNFDHTLKSKINGQYVSCFSYITQIIHNSIIAIINEKNKNEKNIEEYIKMHNESYGIIETPNRESTYINNNEVEINKKITDFSIEKIEKILSEIPSEVKIVNIEYPKKCIISYDDYAKLKPILVKYKSFNINLKKEKH